MNNSKLLDGIIAPVSKELLRSELVVSKFLRETNKGKNQIFILTASNSPNIMLEIGRLREVTFRTAGGGTGKEVDIDEFDHGHFKQLIVWDPENEEIVGGYRFAFMKDLVSEELIHSPTNEIFEFSDKFIEEILPFTIELGRSFVQPNYQPKRDSMKGIFSLDNLWDGLGALVVDNPEMKYFFGKMTMYKDYNRQARNLILYFLEKYFADKDNLVFPKKEFELDIVEREVDLLEDIFVANSFKEDKLILQKALAEIKENIPPLFNAYMSLSPNMKEFGTADNPFFGGVEETGILVTMASIYPKKIERHVESYKKRRILWKHLSPVFYGRFFLLIRHSERRLCHFDLSGEISLKGISSRSTTGLEMTNKQDRNDFRIYISKICFSQLGSINSSLYAVNCIGIDSSFQ